MVKKITSVFNKYINNKRGAKETLHSSLYVTRYITTKGEEKAEILHIFFSSVFNTTVILRVVSFLSWKAGMGSRIKKEWGAE